MSSLGSKVNVVAVVELARVADVHIPLKVPFVLPEGAQLSTSLLGTLLNVNDGPVSLAGATSDPGAGEPGAISYCRDQSVSSQDWSFSALTVQDEPAARRSETCLVVTPRGLLSLQWLDPSVLIVQFMPSGMAVVASPSDLSTSAVSVFYPKRKKSCTYPG